VIGRLDRAAGGLAVDLGLYALSAIFAIITATSSTLATHRAWGSIARWGYAAAALAVLVQLATGRRRGRGLITTATWVATALVPLVVLASRHQAQEEVIVVERAGQRLLDTGTPYLSRAAIAALPPDERLLGYLPYQPGMALFGLTGSDARIGFALVTAVAIGAALAMLGRHSDGSVLAMLGRHADGAALVRAGQAATVLPVCALTLAVGGDDLPVLALCLLALALAARNRLVGAGLAVGAAGALKLFAWPVAAVLLVYAITRGRRAALGYALPAFGLPIAALAPAVLVDAGAVVENLVRFPLGRGLVGSPAQSPFPGYLISVNLSGGRVLAVGLLALAVIVIGVWLLRRPPRDAASAALVCAVGMLAAILLVPSTRFGYLLYPAAYAVWIPALRGSARAADHRSVEQEE
jgi:Glycosyltransferase family 87